VIKPRHLLNGALLAAFATLALTSPSVQTQEYHYRVSFASDEAVELVRAEPKLVAQVFPALLWSRSAERYYSWGKTRYSLLDAGKRRKGASFDEIQTLPPPPGISPENLRQAITAVATLSGWEEDVSRQGAVPLPVPPDGCTITETSNAPEPAMGQSLILMAAIAALAALVNGWVAVHQLAQYGRQGGRSGVSTLDRELGLMEWFQAFQIGLRDAIMDLRLGKIKTQERSHATSFDQPDKPHVSFRQWLKDRDLGGKMRSAAVDMRNRDSSDGPSMREKVSDAKDQLKDIGSQLGDRIHLKGASEKIGKGVAGGTQWVIRKILRR